MSKSCLIIVDVQNDFCPGGALAVKDGDKIIPFINEIAKYGKYDFIITTQDFHPENHISFASTHNVEPFTEVKGEIVWPNHCVVGTEGVKLHEGLNIGVDANFIKAYRENEDSYSGFGGVLDQMEGLEPTSLENWLKDRGVTSVDVVGLAADFCVKATALDAIEKGFETMVLDEGTAAVAEKEPAYKEMEEKGIIVAYSKYVKEFEDTPAEVEEVEEKIEE